MKKLAGNLALLLGTLAVAFLVGEVVVRATFAKDNVLFPRYHTDYAYGKYTLRGVRPNAEFRHTSADGSWTFVTNSRGFRNARDIPYEKPEGTVRILALGDSHTQGYEVRQDFTFAAVAERTLGARLAPAEAINAGVSGWSTAEALAFLENEGVKYRPDVVVLGFYGNDFQDNFKAGLFALGPDGRLEERKHAHIPGVRIQNALFSLAPVRWLSENSYFYSLFFNAVWEHFKALAAKAARRTIATEYAVASPKGVSPAELDLATALVLRMHAFCRENGMRLIVADIPRRPAAHRFTPSIPDAMAERLKAAGVELIEAAALLGPYEGAAELHVPNGHQHISEFTHTLIGVEIARRVAPGDGPIAVKH
ncbi:MAG TPA: GDSL-type esterase/lipase family protein [Burkholderiales bacterium]|nr:GDSL-type esterase/lipase family protein [Burkholderiales bacterium]